MAPAPLFSTDLAPDLVQELRLRRWARENYVPVELRDKTWHADVLDEMRRKDQESHVIDEYGQIARRVVPLAPEPGPTLGGPHHDMIRSHVLARVPFVE